MFDERALQFLVGTMGTERVMLGSDYPFPLGEHDIGSLIRSSPLTSKAKELLLGGNAAEFLGRPKWARRQAPKRRHQSRQRRLCRKQNS